MRQRDREAVTDSDSHGFFDDDGPDSSLFDHVDDPADGSQTESGRTRFADRPSRAERRQHTRRRRRGKVLGLLAATILVVVLLAGYFIALPIYHYFNPADYDGAGTGTVVVTVHANDSAGNIATTLKKDGVIASTRAFTDAASDNDQSQNIQPGSYQLRHHMAAAKALALLLDPSSRLNTAVLVPEGATTLDIIASLTSAPCTTTAKTGTVCGIGASRAAVSKALADVGALGLPTDFTAGGAPKSAEGFLFPATYQFDDTTTVTDALQQMVTSFTEKARDLNFSADAKKMNLTPYQALIIASIAQAEAIFPADMAKVARVILNRIAANRPLQIDATSSYACKLAGTPSSKCIYATVPGPYNSYRNDGLPPTPIDNPGADAMTAAVQVPAGNWLYYVNQDKAGHLFFTNDEHAFLVAVAKCKANHWGCG